MRRHRILATPWFFFSRRPAKHVVRSIQSTLEFKNAAGPVMIANTARGDDACPCNPAFSEASIPSRWQCWLSARYRYWPRWSGFFPRRRLVAARPLNETQQASRKVLPYYVVRHLAGKSEDLSCLRQLEDESAAMYFNVVHGRRVRRRFTTRGPGNRCADYVLVAKQTGSDGRVEEREIALYEARQWPATRLKSPHCR
jgi:hypothetical protein